MFAGGLLGLAPIALTGVFGWREFARMHARSFSHATKSACMGGISAVFAACMLAMLVDIAMGATALP
jgi:hypothetical protein